VLYNDNPDVAVARGGVAYSLSRQGMAPSIAGGSARAYYLLLDTDKAPGVKRRAVCILPRGAQPGSEVTLADRTFGLRVGRPVRFHLVSTVTDLRHGAGDLADLDPADYVALPTISTVLQSDDTKVPKEIPVRLAAALSEVGTLEVHCVDAASGRRWLLEFQLRGEEAAAPDAPQDSRAAAALRRCRREDRPHLRVPRAAGGQQGSAPAARPAREPAGQRANAGRRRCCGTCSTR
jgi:hypothetical protein